MLLEGVRAAGVAYVITASSSSVYGLNTRLPKDESDWVRPLSPYAVTKLAAEQYTLAYQQSFGLKTLAFRFFNVYGPGQRGGHDYAAVIPTFLEALLHGRSLPVHGDGNQSRDFAYVDTVCSALLRAVTEQASHPLPINLTFGTNPAWLPRPRLGPTRAQHGCGMACDRPARRPSAGLSCQCSDRPLHLGQPQQKLFGSIMAGHLLGRGAARVEAWRPPRPPGASLHDRGLAEAVAGAAGDRRTQDQRDRLPAR